MAKGQKTKAGHIIQMIWHGADPNRFNPNGKRVVCHNAEDYDFIEGIEFDKLSRKGAKALIANVPLEEMWTGKLSGPLHYNLMDDQIFPFWIAKGVETPISVGGVPCIDTEYARPQLDRADRVFFSIEEGKAGGGADLGCYGMFTSFKWTSKRGNKGKSRFEVGFATQAAVPRPNLTGGTAQNHKTRITAANVAGALGLSIVAPGVAAKTVSLAIGDTTAQVAAKFAAQGLTVAVTGAIALGAGEVHRLIANNPVGNATIYDTVAVTPGMTATALQAAIQAKGGSYANRSVSGGTTVGQAGGDLGTGGTASASSTGPTSPPSAPFTPTGGVWASGQAPSTNNPQFLAYDRGANRAAIPKSYAMQSRADDGYGTNQKAKNWKFQGSNDGTAWDTLDEQNAPTNFPTNVLTTFPLANVTTKYRYFRILVTATVGNDLFAVNRFIIDSDAVPTTGTYVISMTAEAGDVPDITSAPGAGWTTTVTQAGAAGGALDIEFTDPANALITVNKSSGNAGYVLSIPQPGSDGSILQSMLPDDPIMPGHLFLYSADTPAGLEDEVNLVGQIEEWEIDDPKICLPVSHHVRVNDPERPTLPATYNAHAEEESQEDGIKLSVTMDADEGGIVEGMKALLRASGSRLVSVPRYWRIAAIHPGSLRRVFIDFYGSVGASVPVKWAGSVEQYTFVYDLLENKTAPWNFKAKTRRPA